MGKACNTSATPSKKGKTVSTRSSKRIEKAAISEEETAYERLLRKVQENKNKKSNEQVTKKRKISAEPVINSDKAKGSKKLQPPAEAAAKVARPTQREIVTAQFQEDDIVMDMEVDTEQEKEFLSEEDGELSDSEGE